MRARDIIERTKPLKPTIILCFRGYARFRHYRNLCSKDRPKALREHVTDEEFQKAQAYGRDKAAFGFVETLVDHIQSALMLIYDFLPWLWGVSGQVMFATTGFGSEYEV